MCACVCKYTKGIYVHVLFSLHGCIHSMPKKTLGRLGKGREKYFLCFSCSSQHFFLVCLVCAVTLHLLLLLWKLSLVSFCMNVQSQQKKKNKNIKVFAVGVSSWLQEKKKWNFERKKKGSQSFKRACAKWLILCTLMPCFSRVRSLVENIQPLLLVCCLASAVREPCTDIFFFSLSSFCKTLLCCLIWVTIFCDAVLVINIPHTVLVCCAAWNWDKNCFSVQPAGVRLSWSMNFLWADAWSTKICCLCYLYFMLAKCTYCFSIAKIR